MCSQMCVHILISAHVIFRILYCLKEMKQACSWYSDWAMGWRTKETWFDSQLRQENFYFSKVSPLGVGPTLSPMGTEGSFPKHKMARA
jgi:hypothetical protein